MHFDSLTALATAFEDARQLVRVPAAVDAVGELAEITSRIAKLPDGGPAVLFENVSDTALPVLTNLLGSEARLCRAVGADSYDAIAARLLGLGRMEIATTDSEGGRLDSLKRWAGLAADGPATKTVRNGASQQVLRRGADVDLEQLPLPHCWPTDATASLGQVVAFTGNPVTGRTDVELVTPAARDSRSLALHLDRQRELHRCLDIARRQQQPLPVALVFGADPAFTLASHLPVPRNATGPERGARIRGEAIEMVRGRSLDLEVPAAAELIIEGTIDPDAPWIASGPIGTTTGFAGAVEDVPVLDVTAITHRANPIIPLIIPGPPPMEDAQLGRLAGRCLLPLLQRTVPQTVDVHLPPSGVYRHLAFVSMQKRNPHEAQTVMNAIRALGSPFDAKCVVVVDEDVDVANESQVWYHVGANVHPTRDVSVQPGPTHEADHAAPERYAGSKLGIDATRKLPDEGHPRPWPETLRSQWEIAELVTRRWSEYGCG